MEVLFNVALNRLQYVSHFWRRRFEHRRFDRDRLITKANEKDMSGR